MRTLTEVAQASERARADLVRAVRLAAAAGMTQAEIARAIGRSQPEVSRLLRFHGTSPRAMALRAHREKIRALIKQAGGSHLRVFGSVTTGTDHDGWDIDLLFTMGPTLSLGKLVSLERRISETVGLSVDLVADVELRPDLQNRILGEALVL